MHNFNSSTLQFFNPSILQLFNSSTLQFSTPSYLSFIHVGHFAEKQYARLSMSVE